MTLIFRAHAVGKIMTDAPSVDEALRSEQVKLILAKKKREPEEQALIDEVKLKSLSVGAKTYLRTLAAQEIFGVDFEVSSKYMEKGLRVELECLELINRVRGYSLAKNKARRSDGTFSGEADTLNLPHLRGHDVKASWSVATFPLLPIDCIDAEYEWQMRTYMRLWSLPLWEVNYVLVNTPEDLIGYEPAQMHRVEHIPERFRLTSWVVHRDMDLEARMDVKAERARLYYQHVLEEFDRTHAINLVPEEARTAPPAVQRALIEQAAAPAPRQREEAAEPAANPFA